MSLLSLKTNLKDLKFGKDRQSGGASSQPYIVTPIPGNLSANVEDSLIRGGISAFANSATDTIRIGKFFKDPTHGPLFIIKQTGLQLSNPKIETGKNLGLENTRIYNLGLNTLAQIPVNAFGVHFDRHGLLPVALDANKYLNVVKNKPTEDNRLVKLSKNFGLDFSTETTILDVNKFTSKIIGGITNFRDSKIGKFLGVSRIANSAIEQIKRSSNPKYFKIDDYLGGPGSVYGIGQTTLNRFDFTNESRRVDNPPSLNINWRGTLGLSTKLFELGIEDNQDRAFADLPVDVKSTTIHPLTQTEGTIFTSTHIFNEIDNSVKSPRGIPDSHLNSITFDYQLIKAQQKAGSTDGYVGLIGPDFRDIINKDLGKGKKILPSSDYKNFNMETRIKIGNPGKVTRDRTKINIIDRDTEDELAMVPLFKWKDYDSKNIEVTVKDKDGNPRTYSTRDLIKFRFEAINNSDPRDEENIVMAFRAFITGFRDNPSSEWTPHKYVGRGENFWTYNGFNRSVNFNLKIAAQSRAEMKPLYQKLNYLISNMAPDYQQNGFMRGPFMLLTVGNYFYRQPGILNNLNISVDDNYPWEIAMNEPEAGEDTTMNDLPQLLDVAVTFTPVHNFIPRKGPTVPFINTGPGPDNNWLQSTEFTNI